MHTRFIRLPLQVAFGVLLALSATIAPAAEDHSHHTGSGMPELQLDNGAKWASDDALRSAMSGIRAVINQNLYDVHTGRADNARYQSMADEIEAKIHYMVENCKLPPAADAELHKLIGVLGGAVSEMREGPDRKAGVVKTIKALELYGEYFEHANWHARED